MNDRGDRTPPAWATRLLRRLLPVGTVGASVAADLDEEYRVLRARWSRGKALRWYLWETAKLAGHFAWTGLAARTRASGRRGGAMDRHSRNVRLGLRRLVRAPGFALTAVSTIALGIGAAVTIFSIVDAVLLDPLPYEAPDELVAIWEWHVPRDVRHNVANPGNFAAWRDRSATFQEMTAVSMLQPAKLTGGPRPAEVTAQYAAHDFFAVLGIEASVGRTFLEASTGTETTEVVLSHRYWREFFGGDEHVVGRTFQLNETPVLVVGVLPDDHVAFADGTDLWASIDIEQGDQTNSGRWLMVLGRLGPGATVTQAQAELQTIASRLEEEFPEFNAGWTVNLVPLAEEVVGDVRSVLWVLLAAVGLLLLIACGNVANLFLVRATARRSELAVRRSLGASSGSLFGQLMTESLMVAVVGAGLGVVASFASVRWIASTIPAVFDIPRIGSVSIDTGVLAFAAVLTGGTALLFGLFPGLQAAFQDPGAAFGAEVRGPSRRASRVRDLLVVVEVGLSVVLLFGAALLVRSFEALVSVDDGIEPEQVVVGRVNLSGNRYDDEALQAAFFDELLGNIAARPEVDVAGGITFLPMDGLNAGTSFWPADRPEPPADERQAADILNVEGEYFQAMGVDLLRGRTFAERDGEGAPQRVVVNRTLAERHWPTESAVGKQLVINWVDHTPWEIIGVVEDVRLKGPATEPREAIYLPYEAAPFFSWMHIVARGGGDPAGVTAAVREELSALDEELPLGRVRVMEAIVERAVARPRVTGVLMAIFACLATALAAVGLYGVLSYAVSRRVREIGVRVALGAEPGSVVGLVVRQGVKLVLLGILLGLLITTVTHPYLEALLFGVGPTDPPALLAAASVLFVVALLASLLPAWRAARIAPLEALRPD